MDNNIWARVLDMIKSDIKENSFDRWFSSILSVTRQGDRVYITVPNEHSQTYMEQSFNQLVANYLKLVTNEDLKVTFITNDNDETIIYKNSPKPEIYSQYNHNSFHFNPRYTFESFVVGNSNRFAHAAAMAVAERPSRTYNPLFIYGGSGLGKTHLMHAIAQGVYEKYPGMKVVYVSTESFTNEFISLVRMGKAYAFKDRYRTADIFLIDDIQFITGKVGTQEEFFHTFNTLHEAGKQIVISSDRPPKEIEALEERLRSRFEWGLTTDIQPPDFETRCAILQRKAYTDNINISDDIIFFIADKINSNIRELEGALNRVIHYATLNELSDIDIEQAKLALDGLLPPDKTNEPLTIEIIQKQVADYYKISITDLKSKKRDRFIAFPRQMAMYLCRDILDLPLAKIGEEFGNRDHTTVIHACDKINGYVSNDKKIESALTVIKNNLYK